MIGWTADSGWRGTVAAIIDDGGRVKVLIENAVLPAPHFWSKTKDRHEERLIVRCWQRADQLDIKVGDYVSFTNIDIDYTDREYNCESAENGGSGEFIIIPRPESQVGA